MRISGFPIFRGPRTDVRVPGPSLFDHDVIIDEIESHLEILCGPESLYCRYCTTFPMGTVLEPCHGRLNRASLVDLSPTPNTPCSSLLFSLSCRSLFNVSFPASRAFFESNRETFGQYSKLFHDFAARYVCCTHSRRSSHPHTAN